MRGTKSGWGGGLAAVVLVGCASGGLSQGSLEAYGAFSAETAVGQFLDAAKQKDYRTMARLFGTADGPAERVHGVANVEQRMFYLATELQYESYSLRPVALTESGGRQRLAADMVGTRRGDITLPFITAQHRGRWFVEQIITDALNPGR